MHACIINIIIINYSDPPVLELTKKSEYGNMQSWFYHEMG